MQTTRPLARGRHPQALVPGHDPATLPAALAAGVLAVLLVGLTVLTAGPGEAASAGTSTSRAQRQLSSLGCAVGPVDGRAGLRTRAALVRFQSANHLRRSGALTTGTTRRLADDTAVRCDRRPVVRSGSGRRVVISQRQNYLWLVAATGEVLAQGGMVDNPAVLRRGTYRSGSHCGRAARIRNNSDASGRLRLHNFVRFAPCGVGFHQIPQYRSTGAQIHRDYLLGTDYRVSHGCIRLSGTMSAKIWRFVVPGTKVVVR
jgi:putative peptidoglycan binding protein/L,D-transpeptidase-like protein